MALEQVLSAWGLTGIYLGCIAEGDGVAALGGALAHRHLVSFEGAALAAAAGAITADQLFFWLGRNAGQLAIARRILRRPEAARLLTRVAARPAFICLSFRFVPGMKSLGALSIGAAGVPPLRFTLLGAAAAVVWAHLFTAVGFGASQAIERAVGRLPLHHHFGVLIVGAVLAVALAIAIGRAWRRA